MVPETPSATISSAAISSVDSVKPEIGLLDEPMNPHQIARDRGEEKSHENHHHRCQNGRPNQVRDFDVEQAHQHKHDRDQAEDCFRTHVAFGARQFGLLVGGLAQVRECFADSGGQARRAF